VPNSTTQVPDNARTAQLDNFQEITKTTKMVFANSLNRTVLTTIKFNSDRTNVINANHAPLDKLTADLLTHVLTLLSLDQPVVASNNTTQVPDNAKTAQLDNSQGTLSNTKMVFAV